MAVVEFPETLKSVEVRKRFGKNEEYGCGIYGFSDYGDEKPESGIYRVWRRWGIKQILKHRFYIPSNPQTESQQANRQKMNDGVVAWQALTPQQKNQYNIRAKGKDLSGYNLFLREYLLSH